MKKLVTWIYRVTKPFRSTVSQGDRSQDRLPDNSSQLPNSLPDSHHSNSTQFTIVSLASQLLGSVKQLSGKFTRNTENAPNNDIPPGRIEKFNQQYLKLPEPYSRFLKPFIVTIIVLCTYAVCGFYLLPAILKAKVPDIIQNETGRKASIAQIELNPFTFIASIKGFELAEKNGTPFVNFEYLMADINGFQSIFNLALVIDEISLIKPNVQLAKLKDGKFNFEDLTTSQQKEPKVPDDAELFPFKITKLSLKEGKLLWTNQQFAKAVSEELAPINLSIIDLSTEPDTKGRVDLNLAVKSGGKLKYQSSLGVNPISSEGKLMLDKVQLKQALALALSDAASFNLQGHELFTVDYKAGYEKNDLKIAIKNCRLELQNFQYADKSTSQSIASTPSVAVESDAVLTLAKDAVNVVVKKARLNGHHFSFSQQAPEKISVEVPEFSHEMDIKLTQAADNLKVSTNNAKISMKNFKFSGLTNPVSLTFPEFKHESDIQVTQTKENLSVVANASKLAINQLQFSGFNEGNVQAKIPKLNLENSLQLIFSDNNADININKGWFEFHDLALSEKNENSTLIKIPGFDLKDLAIDLKKKTVNIAAINSKDAEFRAWINPDGSLNYQKLIDTPAEKKAEVKQPNYATAKTVNFKEDVTTATKVASTAIEAVKPEQNWSVTVADLALKNYVVNFEDRSLKKPVVINANPINLSAKNITNKPEAKLPFTLDMGVNKTGLINVKGESVIAPLSAKIDLTIKNLGLKELQPYIEKFARIYLIDARLNLDGKFALLQPKNKPLDLKFKGDAGISNFFTRDKLQNKDLVSWQNLTFKKVDADLLANRYSADTLLIEKPYAKVTIRKDKTLNYSDLMVANNAAPEKATATQKPAKVSQAAQRTSTQNARPVFKLNQVKIVDGSSDFADLSLILPFAAEIQSLDGGAKNISSEQNSTINVDLKGSAYDIAPVDINGEISPYVGNYNINLRFDGLPMPLVTPYMVQFSGYRIEKGKLNLGLEYQVKKGELKAANNILIDQLELGEKVDNPDAVSLPLELAIAILKDSDGKIKLDVPLSGSLEDPQFSIGKIVVDAIVNVLTKIVTSPFNALASLVGSQENLSVVKFSPGKSSLDHIETKKLDDVAKVLKEKSSLNLEIKGASFEEQDWPILRETALLEQLKSIKAVELSEEEERKVRLEQFKLSEDDYNDLLADEFIKKFPAMAEKSIFGKPQLIKPLTGDFYQVAKQKMSESIKPEAKRLKDLATNRTQAIAKYIVLKAGIPSDRVFVLDSVVNPQREGKDIVSALSLKTH